MFPALFLLIFLGFPVAFSVIGSAFIFGIFTFGCFCLFPLPPGRATRFYSIKTCDREDRTVITQLIFVSSDGAGPPLGPGDRLVCPAFALLKP